MDSEDGWAPPSLSLKLLVSLASESVDVPRSLVDSLSRGSCGREHIELHDRVLRAALLVHNTPDLGTPIGERFGVEENALCLRKSQIDEENFIEFDGGWIGVREVREGRIKELKRRKLGRIALL